MKFDNRYIQNEGQYLRYSKAALGHCFVSLTEFDSFYSSLPDDYAKNEFLRVASFYLFLVQKGDWWTDVGNGSTVTDYLTNSYKLIGIFALIESLSELEHQDFYRWLYSRRKEGIVFPIESAKALEALYSEYNRVHGATNFCVAFFERLTTKEQAVLMRAIRIRRKPVTTVKRAVQVLYGLRSRFVHEGQLLVQLSSRGTVMSKIKDKLHYFDLNISKIAELFEQALIMHFVTLVSQRLIE